MKIVNRNKESIMDDNKSMFLEFVKEHDGELVIDFFRVEQLVGFAEDDEDYYYIVKGIEGIEQWVSCVMDLIPLKGVLPEDSYNRLLKVFELNQERK
jgi:hypothetical protein